MLPWEAQQSWGKRRVISRKGERSRVAWERAHDERLGKESRTEDETKPDGDWDVMSERRKSEHFGKGIRYPKQGDRDRRRGRRCSIASQTLGPGESPMCSRCARKRPSWRGLSRWRGFSQSDVDPLVTKELHQLPPMGATLPIAPEHRTGIRKRLSRCRWRLRWDRQRGARRWRAWNDRPKNRADPSWFDGGSALTLTLLATGTGAAVTDARCIQKAQGAVPFKSSFLGIERVRSRATQRPIGLQRKSRSCKSSRKRRACKLRRAIRSGLRRLGRLYGLHRLRSLRTGKLRCTHGRGMERMPQFQTQIPDPLREDEPKLLAPGGVRTPAVRILNSKPLRNIASLTIVSKPF
jgi:hypothetical protein